jgi:predicted nucleic acid-binding protein
MFLLDTTTLSDLRNSSRWSPGSARWERTSDLRLSFISTISEFEIQHGIHRVQPNDPKFAAALQNWFDHTLKPAFEKRIIPINSKISHTAAQLTLLPSRDLPNLLIAATALVHDLTVVTRNVKHFQDTGVKILNPWQ